MTLHSLFTLVVRVAASMWAKLFRPAHPKKIRVRLKVDLSIDNQPTSSKATAIQNDRELRNSERPALPPKSIDRD